MTFKLIKASIATLALLAVPFAAQAADVPIKAPYYKGAPSSVVSYYNWTGFYAGMNAGYGFGSSDLVGPRRSRSSRKASWPAARRLQLAIRRHRLRHSRATSTGRTSRAALQPALGVTCETSSDWLATFRGRVGYAFDRLAAVSHGRRRYTATSRRP